MAVSSNRGKWISVTPKAPWEVAINFLSRSGVWNRIGLLLFFITALFVLMFGWDPAFPYRTRIAPLRNLHARTAFEAVDSDATSLARELAREKFACYYINSPRRLDQLRKGLIDDLFEIQQKTLNELNTNNLWSRFIAIDPETNQAKPDDGKEKDFEKFKNSLVKDEKLSVVEKSIENAFGDIRNFGVLKILEHELTDGSMQQIQVYESNIDDAVLVEVENIRLAEALDRLKRSLTEELGKNAEVISEPAVVADRIVNWLKPRLPTTLTWDEENSKRGRRQAAREVARKYKQYSPGDPLEKLNYSGVEEPIIRALVPLDENDIQLLRQEHQAYAQSLSVQHRLIRSAAFYGLFIAIAALICGYLYYRDDAVLYDLGHFVTLLALFSGTIGIAWLLALDVNWRAEIVPIIMFSVIVAIAYRIELAIFLSAMLTLTFSVLHAYGLGEFVILTIASTTAALLCRTIRSRTKLVYVGLTVAAAVFPTVVGVQFLLGQPILNSLLVEASWFSANAALAGLFITAMLPFLERWFGIQTDINLLELSDANHPLLKELVQRAPGTYNHSINVASISEAAAEAIGANGLLCRVGAYFHDIGKLRKPEYFIENQGGGENKHDDLNPAMSTLVIIAHVKEGAELARQHNLPERIIDLIEQHHGTTLVRYFFDRATRQSEIDEDSTEVQDIDYRYPGPKPQTREAAVMMLADAVESASRALREPTPSRIENLVDDIAKQKLDDGQFDECEITLLELHAIQENLIKSLNAMYHARVKYPDQQSA